MSILEDRSAGRWCETCRRHGSHHTDRHHEFVRAALWDVIAKARDEYPRRSDDAPTDDVVDAILAAFWVGPL